MSLLNFVYNFSYSSIVHSCHCNHGKLNDIYQVSFNTLCMSFIYVESLTVGVNMFSLRFFLGRFLEFSLPYMHVICTCNLRADLS